MKPRTSSSQPRSDDNHIEHETVSILGQQTGECAKLIYSIKQYVYDLVQINVPASVPIKSYDTASAVVAGTKRNLQDLRRLESMLKGYVSRVKGDDNNKNRQNEEDIRKSEVNSVSSPFSSKSEVQIQRNKNIYGSRDISDISPAIYGSVVSEQGKLGTTTQIQDLKIQNFKLQLEMQKLRQAHASSTHKFQQVSLSEANSSKSKSKSKAEERQQRSGLFKSISNTNINLMKVRSRNRECLQLLQTIRRQILHEDVY